MSGGVAFAGVAAVLFGVSDLLAARASRRGGAVLSVTRTAVAVSVVVTMPVAFGLGVAVSMRELMVGAMSGVAMIGGIAVLYFGYSRSRIGLVAPVSAVTTAGLPVGVGLAVGGTMEGFVVAGVVLGFVALVLTSVQAGAVKWDARAFLLGLGAGSLIGVGFLLMGFVTAGFELSAVAAQRIAGLGLLAVFWISRSERFFVGAGPLRRLAVACGVCATAAVVVLQFAFKSGEIGPVALVGSQFVTVAVVLAVVFEHERLRWWQTIGVCCTAAAVGLIAVR
jgi:uncharacterized membrane protein